MSTINVIRGRTTIVPVSLSYDVSKDILVSEIREGRNPETALIAAWDITFKTDGKDGNLILTLDDSVTSNIQHHMGYMDIKRISGGEPFNVFDDPIQVNFKDPITE